jgi:peptide/nickel transport system substrate-binding protein
MRNRPRHGANVAAGLIALAIVMMASVPAAAPSTTPNASNSRTIVTIAGGGAPLTSNFNPFSTSGVLALTGTSNLIFEPMFIANTLDPNAITPWLAKSWSLNASNTVLTATLQSGIEWSDGKPFSAADVAFTFNLLAKYPQFNTVGLPITSASAIGSNQVQLTFSTNVSNDLALIGGIPIVPQHIWASAGNPTTFTDPDPVGTGPFTLSPSSFSSQGFLLERNPHYWQKDLQPKIAGIRFVAYESNTSADLALENGQADWAGDFVPDVQRLYVDRNPDNHIWFPSTGVDYLCPNDSLAKYANADVRQAISDAIDRNEVSIDGESGELQPATSPTGMVLPLQSADLSPTYAHARLTDDPPRAISLLAAAGYHRKDGGKMTGPNGQQLSVTLDVPSSWTDTLADFQVVAQNLSAIGINATVDSQSFNEWVSNLVTGNTDMSICLSSLVGTTATPYETFQVINGNLTKPVGQVTLTDTERYDNPQANALLKSWATTTSAAVKKQDMFGLEGIMATQMPVIPLVNTAAWAEYSTASVKGWPSAADPYATAEPSGANMLEVALHLTPVDPGKN